MKPFVFFFLFILCIACTRQKEHVAPAINEKDSIGSMITYGVNTLISDSGVMKYRIVAECWAVNDKHNPPHWSFEKGIFMQQFDSTFQVAAIVTADTAWFYNMQKLWKLRGRVTIRNNAGLVFHSEELFWDQHSHEFYSNCYSRLFTPERQLEGISFRSDEYMTNYRVVTAKGVVPSGDVMAEPASPPAKDAANDSAVTVIMPHSAPQARPKSVMTRHDSLARRQILRSRENLSKANRK